MRGSSRWVRKGKLAAWGPGIEDWEVRPAGHFIFRSNLTWWQIEDRARKRMKLLLPSSPDPDVPITLPHLRSPTPPFTAPYPQPATHHLSYTSFVLDKSVTQTYRSGIIDEQELATNTLIEGEAAGQGPIETRPCRSCSYVTTIFPSVRSQPFSGPLSTRYRSTKKIL